MVNVEMCDISFLLKVEKNKKLDFTGIIKEIICLPFRYAGTGAASFTTS